MRIGLEFTAEQGSVHRARLDYAFRLFCAVYGHEPISGTRQNESGGCVRQLCPWRRVTRAPGGWRSVTCTGRDLRETPHPRRTAATLTATLPSCCIRLSRAKLPTGWARFSNGFPARMNTAWNTGMR